MKADTIPTELPGAAGHFGRDPDAKPYALRAALIYALAGTIWILTSDWGAAWLFPDAATLILVQFIKGLLFVAVTAVFVYILIAKYAGQAARLRSWYRKLFELSPDAVLVIGPKGNFVDANGVALERYGLPPDSLSEWTLRDLAPEPLREEMEVQIRAARHGPVAFEGRQCTVDGREIEVEITAVPVRMENGRYVLCTVHDMSDLKKAESDLRKIEEFQRAMITCTPLALISIDADGNILSWNKSAEEMFGWSGEEVLGRPVPFVPPEKQREFAALRARIMRGGSLAGLELLRRTKEGSPIHISLFAAPIRDGHGDVIGIMAAVEDIGKRVEEREKSDRLEAQLQQARKMEAIGRLAGGVAHDFNNMLSVILGYVDYCLKRMDEDDPMREYLEEVQSAGRRSAGLTRQLLAFARKQPVAPRVVDLNRAVTDMLRMLKRLIGVDVEVVWRPGGELWKVRIDPTQLDQILVNLGLNARDAMAGRGRMTLSTRNLNREESATEEPRDLESGEYVLLQIEDTGCGMEPDTLDHLFEPFFTTKSLGEGTGLGLATVYGAVSQNDGVIHVESVPGVGTSFKIFLPRCRELETEPKQEPASVEPVRGNETVLLIEDEEALLEFSKVLLEELGYQVLAADHPETALELARQHRGEIRLLLTDVIMPGMTGWEAWEKLREILPDLKPVFMSGYTADAFDGQRMRQQGMQFLEKPFSREKLASKLRAALAE